MSGVARVKLAKLAGPRVVPHLGVLTGYAVVEAESGEPLQWLLEGSSVEANLAQWQARFDGWAERASRR